MTRKLKIIHLVDDTTAGGVMRVVDFIESSNKNQDRFHHERVAVSRGKLQATRFDADVIVSHLTISWRSIPALYVMRTANAGTPIIHVEHSYTEAFVAHNVRNQARFTTLLRVGFAIFDQIIAVSHAQAKWFLAKQLCPARRVTTIQSCVDLAAFRALPLREGPGRVIGAIGRLDRQKGFDRLITAFKGCPDKDLVLHIYGEGEEEAALKALASGDPRILFKGFTTTPTEAFEGADIVVMPSRWEAYGLVAIEALSAGRALICSDVDGLRDHVELGAETLEEGALDNLQVRLEALKVRPQSQKEMQKVNMLETTFFAKWASLLSLMAADDAKFALGKAISGR